jgi:sugar phosphate isomerase/epimerase
MTMRLSFYTYSYTDRQNLSIADCLARIARTGYVGIDESGTFGDSADPRSVTPSRRRDVRETARKHKLSVEAVITHAELTRTLVSPAPLDLVGSVDLAVDLGAPLVTFHLGGPVKELAAAALWSETVAAIRTAARYGATRHVALAIDLGPWPEWIVNSSDSLARLFDDVAEPDFGVNFDPSYLTLMGIDPVPFVRRFASRIKHAHLKDHVGRYPKWEHRIPGKGELNYVPIFAALMEAKFKGSMAVECFVDMKFEEACDDGYAAMTQALRKAGSA